MNRENLTKLAEWLEAGAPHERLVFDMETGITFYVAEEFDPNELATCGASCCIAGAAIEFFGKPQYLYDDLLIEGDRDPKDTGNDNEISAPWYRVKTMAGQLLDIDPEEAEDLFTPNFRWGGDLTDYNDPAWAARTIRHLLATGEVNWAATRDGEAPDLPYLDLTPAFPDPA